MQIRGLKHAAAGALSLALVFGSALAMAAPAGWNPQFADTMRIAWSAIGANSEPVIQ